MSNGAPRDRAKVYEGFAEEYHTSPITITALYFVSLVGLTELFFPGTVDAFVSALPFSPSEVVHFLATNRGAIVAFMAFSVVLIVVHESIHFFMHRLNGFDPTYGIMVMWMWKIPELAAYVVVLDDPLPRNENMIGLAAPLVVLTTVGLVGLLPVFPETVTYYAKLLLVLNTTWSCADIYNLMRVSRYPPGTRFQNEMDEGAVRTFVETPQE